ncbi:MAG TPA: VOC family protein [Longimicrobiales bacterium]|nr:VOC family protein [Longimicrobiales bacterium]
MAQIHPPVNGIHEAALYVDDLAEAERFWRRLGLQLITRDEGRHVFFRIGRDLLLCFNAAATRDGGRVPAHGAEGPGHVAFDVPDLEALDRWRAFLEMAGIDVEAELDWPAGGRSLYFRDPAGNSIELITRGAWGF